MTGSASVLSSIGLLVGGITWLVASLFLAAIPLFFVLIGSAIASVAQAGLAGLANSSRCLRVIDPSRTGSDTSTLMLTSWSDVSTPALLSMASVLI